MSDEYLEALKKASSQSQVEKPKEEQNHDCEKSDDGFEELEVELNFDEEEKKNTSQEEESIGQSFDEAINEPDISDL